jgi:hypothetical protein
MSPRTATRLNFQKGFAFFNSINWKATKRNLIEENPIINRGTVFEKKSDFEIKAANKVSKINNP